MTDELKRPTLLGGATVVHDECGNAYSARQVEKAFVEYAQMLDPRNSDPGFEEKQRAAQELMSRQHHEARQSMQDPRTRTLEQHAAHLRAYNSSNADQAEKRTYMLDHGLEYNNGTLGYAPNTVHREAAWEAQQRLGQADRPLATSSGRVDGISLAQQSRAPGKMFSRMEILAIIAAERTKWVNEPTELGGMRYRAAMQTLDEMQRIFENLE